MRYIPLKDHAPDAAWVAKAQALLDDLKKAPDAAARNEIIDLKSGVWGELNGWLLSLSYQKCWFSEAKDCFSHWDVEHFRPKKSAKDLDGTTHEGYWWLAFAWENYRICGNAGNRMKGTCFPLRAKCPRCAPHGDIRYEDVMLLDPADEHDPGLLSFNMVGEAIVASHVTNSWERERVEYSVHRCNLLFEPLVNKRKTIWAECWNRVQKYLRELERYQADNTNVIAKNGIRDAAKSIREMMKEDKEFSAVARACVESTGDKRVDSLLRTN